MLCSCQLRECVSSVCAVRAAAGGAGERKSSKESKPLLTPQDVRAGAGVKLNESGELVLADGRILGHRQYVRYYKQVYKPEGALCVLPWHVCDVHVRD